MALHENIRARRTQLKLSQEYVAEKLGVSRQAVAKWEAGKSEPTAANMARLAALFEMSISELAAPAQDETKPAGHNARMLVGRYGAGGLINAGWDGYSSGLYTSPPALWLATLCAGLAVMLIRSLDMQIRGRLQRLQLAAGAALLFSIFFLPGLVPTANTGLNSFLADIATIFFACVRGLKYWRHIWPTR